MLVVVMHVHVIDVDACKSSPCQNQGGCITLREAFRCDCNGDYVGATCSGKYCADLISVMCCIFH